MKNSFVLGILLLIFVASVHGCSSDDDNILNTTELTQSEKNDLLVIREEEKLARDVYLYANDKYHAGPFANISNSEQRHMDAVLTLLEKYNISDPASSERGIFQNEQLQNLYNELTAKVDSSYLDALIVGCTIEDLDIKDIQEFETRTANEEIFDVYNFLKCGSRNHLRAFYRITVGEGGSYNPQFISQEEFDSIINSSHEQCNSK